MTWGRFTGYVHVMLKAELLCSCMRKTQGIPQLQQLPLEQPPPYEGSSRPRTVPPPPRSNSVFQSASQQHVNFITLESKHNEISGK